MRIIKHDKFLLCLILALVLCFTMAIPVFAAEGEGNPTSNGDEPIIRPFSHAYEGGNHTYFWDGSVMTIFDVNVGKTAIYRKMVCSGCGYSYWLFDFYAMQ